MDIGFKVIFGDLTHNFLHGSLFPIFTPHLEKDEIVCLILTV